MKKRMYILFVCFSLIFTTGCSMTPSANSNENGATSDGIVSENSESTNNENTASENNDAENVNIENAVSEKNDNESNGNEDTNSKDTTQLALYSVIPTQDSFQYTAEDGTPLLYSDYQTLDISGKDYPVLAEAFRQWQKQRIHELEKTLADYSEIAKEDSLSYDEFYGYSVSQSYAVKRLDHSILSIIDSYSEYTGGAHPSYYQDGINFDVATGKLLTLADITKDYATFTEAALPYITDYLKNLDTFDLGYYDDYETIVKESLDTIPWYFSASGITLMYNPYMIAPYAAGRFEVTLPFDTFKSYIKDEYHLTTATGVASIVYDGKTNAIVPTSSGSYSLTITDGYYVDGPEVYEDVPPVITFNGTSFTTEKYFLYLRNCYLIQQPERTLLMIDGDMASEDYTTALFDVTDGTLKEISSIFASVETPGVDTVTLSVRQDVLGTYFTTANYDLTAGKEFHMMSDSYSIATPYSPLVTTRELPVTNSNNEKILLPAGTSLTPTTTDGETFVTISVEGDSDTYTIHFTREDYTIMIDGVEEYEYFEMLPYAG